MGRSWSSKLYLRVGLGSIPAEAATLPVLQETVSDELDWCEWTAVRWGKCWKSLEDCQGKGFLGGGWVRELGQFINHSKALILFYSVQLPGMLLFYPRAFALVVPSHWNILQDLTLSPLSPPAQSQWNLPWRPCLIAVNTYTQFPISSHLLYFS